MVEENTNPSPEELRRKIQERLQSMKESEAGTQQAKETPKEVEVAKQEAPVQQPKNPNREEPKKNPIVKKNNLQKKEIGGMKKEVGGVKKKEINAKKEIGENLENETPKSKAGKEPTPKKITKDISDKSNSEEKSNNKLVVILISLLVVAIGLFTWQYLKSTSLENKNENQAKEINNLNDEKTSIQSELENLLGDYKKLESSNEELNAQLEAERQKIEEYITQVKKLQGKAQQYDFYRRKLKELEKNKEKYIAQIDSLTTQNKILSKENATFKTDLEKTQGENELLAGKVALAKQIKGVNMKAEALTIKGKPTTKAKKVSELKICITLVENPIAEPGIKDVFIRIVEPKGSIMISSKDNLFEANGEEIAYTASGQIDYQNAEVTACIKHGVEAKSLDPGNYDLEVFVDGTLIGSRNIQLD